MTRRRLSALALVLLGAISLPASAQASPGDSLSVPLFSDRSEALWPLQVGLEVVALDGDDSGELVVERRELVVTDGQHTVFSAAIATPQGSHGFEVELVARHHAGGAIELEYDLHVREARFEGLTWTDYLLHRLALAPRPMVGPEALAAARADIVETREARSGDAEVPAHSQTVDVDGQRYEIRLYAASLRG
jgi:hypothetical protein